jgi:hypothetical protein
MSDNRLAGLQILATGIESLMSREVVRLLVSEGAVVTAADRDERALNRFQRDLGLYRTSALLAPIDLFSKSEMQLFAQNMQYLGRLPHLIVCCCEKAACPATLAAWLMQPSFLLHASPRGCARLPRIISEINIPSLCDLLATQRQPALFDPRARPRRTSIAGYVFDLTWHDAGQRPTAKPAAPPSTQISASGSPRRARSNGLAPSLTSKPTLPTKKVTP